MLTMGYFVMFLEKTIKYITETVNKFKLIINTVAYIVWLQEIKVNNTDCCYCGCHLDKVGSHFFIWCRPSYNHCIFFVVNITIDMEILTVVDKKVHGAYFKLLNKKTITACNIDYMGDSDRIEVVGTTRVII